MRVLPLAVFTADDKQIFTAHSTLDLPVQACKNATLTLQVRIAILASVFVNSTNLNH